MTPSAADLGLALDIRFLAQPSAAFARRSALRVRACSRGPAEAARAPGLPAPRWNATPLHGAAWHSSGELEALVPERPLLGLGCKPARGAHSVSRRQRSAVLRI